MKNKIIISTIIILLLILAGTLVYKTFVLNKHFKNDYLKFEYDNIWKLEKKDTISLNNEQANIKIYIKELEPSTNNNIDTLKNIIKAEYQDYRLLHEDTNIINNFNYDSASIIVENDEKQTLTTLLKKAEYLIILEYSNTKEEFDIYIDNVIKIISKLEIIGE